MNAKLTKWPSRRWLPKLTNDTKLLENITNSVLVAFFEVIFVVPSLSVMPTTPKPLSVFKHILIELLYGYLFCDIFISFIVNVFTSSGMLLHPLLISFHLVIVFFHMAITWVHNNRTGLLLSVVMANRYTYICHCSRQCRVIFGHCEWLLGSGHRKGIDGTWVCGYSWRVLGLPAASLCRSEVWLVVWWPPKHADKWLVSDYSVIDIILVILKPPLPSSFSDTIRCTMSWNMFIVHDFTLYTLHSHGQLPKSGPTSRPPSTALIRYWFLSVHLPPVRDWAPAQDVPRCHLKPDIVPPERLIAA